MHVRSLIDLKLEGDNAGVLLWDIDGTLVLKKSGSLKSVHLFALQASPRITIDTDLTGLSDWDVLKELKSKYNLQQISLEEAFSDLDRIQDFSKFGKFEKVEGVENLLTFCNQNGWINGILTGNTFKRAQYKLNDCGLIKYFSKDLFFCCELGEDRNAISLRAKETIFKKNQNIIIIGDTKHDVASAINCNLPIIAIAADSEKSIQLINQGANIVLENLLIDEKNFNSHLISLKRN